MRRHRLRDRRQQPLLPPDAPGLARHRSPRQGSAAQSRRLDRPRLQLHLPGRPLQGDDRTHDGERAPVQGPRRFHPLRRDRGRPNQRADAGAGTPGRFGHRLGDRGHVALVAGRCQGVRALHQREGHPRRLSHRGRGRGRLAARGHPDARDGRRNRRPPRRAQDRGGRHRHRARPGQARAHDRRRHRGRDGRHHLRGVEPAPGSHGRGADPADARRAPDDRHRPGSTVQRREVRHRAPDRARHGHQHVRAAGGWRPRDRVLRPPTDPLRPGGPPLGGAGGALTHRVSLHAG